MQRWGRGGGHRLQKQLIVPFICELGSEDKQWRGEIITFLERAWSGTVLRTMRSLWKSIWGIIGLRTWISTIKCVSSLQQSYFNNRHGGGINTCFFFFKKMRLVLDMFDIYLLCKIIICVASSLRKLGVYWKPRLSGCKCATRKVNKCLMWSKLFSSRGQGVASVYCCSCWQWSRRGRVPSYFTAEWDRPESAAPHCFHEGAADPSWARIL